MSEMSSEPTTPESDVFGLNAVRELLRLINQTDITEILIERGEVKLHVKRGNAGAATPVTPDPIAAPGGGSAAAAHSVQPFVSPPPPPEGPPASRPAGHTITAPMVGTFYAAPSPKDPPFVQEGDAIHMGDRVGIIEAMKMLNEIESEYSGRVARILVKNGQGVEYGQPLMVIEPL